MDWMIEVEGLVKTFGHLTAVDGVSLDSEDKENNNYNINGTFVNDKK